MQKEVWTFEKFMSMDMPEIIIWAAPIMFALVILEWILTIRQKKDYYDGKDTLAATIIGLGNIGVSAVTKIFTFGVILFFINLVPWTMPTTWWSYILCFIVIDFCRYAGHRVAHENRLFWATHVTHHSSEKYNFSVSFRLSWTQHIKIIFFIPAALLGVHPVVFFICHQIAVLYQFWLHTEYIRTLPAFISYIFVTPSHHRVHHGRNEKYLDKNYGSTFIIWDRIFGTFQEEEEQVDYGITTPVNSYNPVYLVFHEWIDIFKDAFRSRSLKQAFMLTFARPSRLADIKRRFDQEKEPSFVDTQESIPAPPVEERA